MKKKILAVFMMLVVVCVIPLSVSADKIDARAKKSINNLISFAIKHPNMLMTKLILLYFMVLLSMNPDMRLKMLEEEYWI